MLIWKKVSHLIFVLLRTPDLRTRSAWANCSAIEAVRIWSIPTRLPFRTHATCFHLNNHKIKQKINRKKWNITGSRAFFRKDVFAKRISAKWNALKTTWEERDTVPNFVTLNHKVFSEWLHFLGMCPDTLLTGDLWTPAIRFSSKMQIWNQIRFLKYRF